MEILGERPAWAMSDSEKLSALDAVVAERARLRVLELRLIAELERSRHAQEIGAGDTARLLNERYRIDLPTARRTVRLAVGLTNHPATSAALPDPTTPFHNPATAHPRPEDNGAESDAEKNGAEPDTPVGADLSEQAEDAGQGEDAGDGAGGNDAEPGADDAEPGADDAEPGADDAGPGAPGGWRVHPAQAEAILSVLAKIPTTVPIENVEFAEQQLIVLAATHTPSELRAAGKKIRDLLDPDGPEPDEKLAYTRESLTWKNADQGVTFRGYLACENAELFRTLIHAGARPRKTVDGELDPRSREKRQADALTTILNAAGDAATSASHSATATTAAPTEPAPDPLPDLEAASAPDGGGAGYVAGHGVKAHISVTIDYHALKTATANATGGLVFGDTLSAATIRRLACEAEILPIVLGSKSQPLDVGTSQRLVTRPMRRALNARDKGCVVCGAPPIQCEAHHLKHWIDGGITAVSNLVLLRLSHESSGPRGGAVFGGPGRPAGQAGAACCNLRRLWTVQMRRHSLCTAGRLRRAKRRNRRLCLMLPKTGSMLEERFL